VFWDAAEEHAAPIGGVPKAEWRAFTRKCRAAMAAPEAQHALALLATLSTQTNFSMGCSCEDEARCPRPLLRELLAEKGAKIQA
jgi:uncharacterized protein YeaO (DUF488 family)